MPFGLEVKDLIVFGAGAIIALFVAYFFHNKGLQRKQLTYTVRIRSLVYRSRNYPASLGSGLKITFDGRDVNKLMRATVFVWNSGNQTMTKQDLGTTAHLALGLPEKGFDALQISIPDQTRKSNNVVIEGRELTFDYLNPRDGFVIDIFGNESDEKVSLFENIRSVKLTGEIVGASEVQYSPYERSITRGPAYLFIISGLLCGLVAALFVIAPFSGNISPETQRALNIIFASVFGCVSAVAILVGLISFFKTRRMPRALLARDEGPRVPWILHTVLPPARSSPVHHSGP